MKTLFKSPAQVMIVLWAVGWTKFLVSEFLTWRDEIRTTPLWLLLACVFMLVAIVPQRWEAQGGALLIACGLALLAAYDIWHPTEMKSGLVALLGLLLTVPPLTTGLYFLGHGLNRAAAHGAAAR